MSERTTNTLLGAFVIGGLVILAGLALSILDSGLGRNAQPVRMIFDGSVTGLNIGAPVALRGVQIGQVTDIRVRLDDVEGLKVVMEVDADLDASRIQQDLQEISGIDSSLVEAGLRAQLNSQSLLTGLLYVQLDFHPDTEVNLHALTDDRFEIPTIPAPFEQFIQQLDDLQLPTMANDLQAITGALKRFTENPDFQALPARTVAAIDATEQVLVSLDETIVSLSPQFGETLAATQVTLETLNDTAPELVSQLNTSLRSLETTMASIAAASDQLNGVMAPDSPLLLSLTTALRQAERTGRSLNALMRNLNEQPDSLIFGRDEENAKP